MTRRQRWSAAWLLLLVSPVCAEYLSAYDDTTGRPFALVFGLLFFVPLYGAPALLIREFARARGLGWHGIILLAIAMGLVQAGLIDQSLFTVEYRDIGEAEASTLATWVPVVGLGAVNLLNYVGGHALYSFGGPIALAEGVGGDRERWVGPFGLVLAFLAWAAVAAMICVSTVTEEDGASAGQVVGTLVVVALLVLAAVRMGPAPARSGPVPGPWVVFGVALVLAAVQSFSPETWLGVATTTVSLVAMLWYLLRYGTRPGWTRRHAVAFALGALLHRALLAFTYYPLVGETSAAQKYGHNVAMLVIVVAAGAVAWRGSGTSAARPAQTPRA